jgi:hypothetical protein
MFMFYAVPSQLYTIHDHVNTRERSLRLSTLCVKHIEDERNKVSEYHFPGTYDDEVRVRGLVYTMKFTMIMPLLTQCQDPLTCK